MNIEQLYKTYLPLIRYRLSIHGIPVQDQRDEIQNVMLKIIKGFSSFDESKGSWANWITVIVKNHCYDRHRRVKKRVVPISHAYSKRIRSTANDKFDLAVIKKELGKLKLKERVCLFYRKQGYSYEEIAEEVGIPLGSVRTFVFRGRASLRERLN